MRIAVLACALPLAVAAAGCGWVKDGTLEAVLRPLSTPGQAHLDTPDQAPPGGGEAADRQVLADAHWSRAVPLAEAARADADAVDRWHQRGIEDIVARPPQARPDLARALADNDPTVATNAAIALARLGNSAGLAALTAAVRASRRPSVLRCAAAEALGRLPSDVAARPLNELAGEFGQPDRSGYFSELHAELLRALARHVDPAGNPHFAAALHSPSAEVRQEVVRAWQRSRSGDLPAELLALRSDCDLRVRGELWKLTAARHYPPALTWLVAAAYDRELRGRLEAIAALGVFGGPEAQAALVKLHENQPELIRAAAVAALAVAGDRAHVAEAAKDRGWRVRAAVADALAAYPDRPGADLAAELLRDANLDVQQRVLASVRGWPLELAGPVLLDALETGGYLVRKRAAEQLSATWPPAREFSVDATSAQRAEVLATLRTRLRQDMAGGRLASAAPPRPAVDDAPGTPTGTELQLVEAALREIGAASAEPPPPAAVGSLTGLGPRLLPALDRLLSVRQVEVPEVVYQDVLPTMGPAFAALQRLQSRDLNQRREAAEKLADLAAQHPLGRTAIGRLAALVLREPDAQIWQCVLAAVSGDGSEPALGLAAAGLSHPSADVRRRACENLAAHPRPQHAALLAPSLEDSSPAVVTAAVRALGTCAPAAAPPALRQLLAAPGEALRLDAATALARLGDPAGPAALERLAYSGEPAIRRQTAVAMGELGDAVFAGTLIRLLDDRPAVQRAALESLPRVAGGAPAPAAAQWRPDTAEQIRQWKRWFESRGVTPAGQAAADSANGWHAVNDAAKGPQ